MEPTNPPGAPYPCAANDAPSTNESGPALDGEPARSLPHRPGNLVVISLICALLLFAIGFTALQDAFVTLTAHFILAHAIPPMLHQLSEPFAAASLKATFVLTLIGTPLVLLPELLHTAYSFLRAGVDLASLRTRRATRSRRRPSSAARLNAQRAMHHVLMAASAPVGSLIYRALWCSPGEKCDALDPLHATIAAVAGGVLFSSYLFVRERFAGDVSEAEELERLRQEELDVEHGGMDKQSPGAKARDGTFQGHSVV